MKSTEQKWSEELKMFKLESVSWERIYANLKVVATENELAMEDLHFYLVDSADSDTCEFAVTGRSADTVYLRINVSNPGINRCIANGNYHVIAAQGTQIIAPVLCFERSDSFALWNNHFLYNGTAGCYSVTFMVDEFTALPELKILIYDAKRRDVKQQPVGFMEKHILPRKRKLIKKTNRFFNHLALKYYRFMRRGRDGRGILFFSEMDNHLALNMQAVYNRLRERGLDQKYRITFFLRRYSDSPFSWKEKIRRIQLVSKADIILVDDYVSYFDEFPLDEDVRLIQIWHAGAGFKGVGYSRWGHYGCPSPYCAHRRYNYCIAGSKAIASFFSEQFGILDEQIIPTGMPRMDEYMDEGHRKEVTAKLYKTYPQLAEKEVILFAPTYRGQGLKTAHYPYEMVDFAALYRYCCENNAVVLFKMHPWVSDPVPIDATWADRFLDFNRYPNINDLFYITDLLITDYSSSMYEFILMKKPILLYAFDKNQYATSRGFHRDFDSNVPGKICETFDGLMEAIWKRDFQFEKVEQLLSYYFDQVDTGSTDRVIDWLILGELPQEYRAALENKNAAVAATRSLRLVRQDPDSWEGAVLLPKEVIAAQNGKLQWQSEKCPTLSN